MYVDGMRYTKYKKGGQNEVYRVFVNASHVEIQRDGKVVWKRKPEMDEWYDEKHVAIVKALEQLEKALAVATTPA